MEEPINFEILYQDEHLVAINKPNGIMVHRSKLAGRDEKFVLQELRNQIDQHVYPAHRIDKKTSGVLLFTLTPDCLSKIRIQFEEKTVQKEYLSIVRGFTDERGTIDYALMSEKGKSQEAVTHYETLQTSEIDLAYGKHQTSRYSLLKVIPETGRMHQIRKHFAHIFHPIIGDRPHGCNKQNKLFLNKWGMDKMLLHANKLTIKHPVTDQFITFQADLPLEFNRMIKELNFTTPV
ncbi:MAG: pseudouridine synthase [Reichenbachiella sp.]